MFNFLPFLSISNFTNDECQPGMTWVLYGGEVFFVREKERKIIDHLDLDFKYSYCSIAVTGSFCPNRTGRYKFRLKGKSYSQIVFYGNKYPSSMGPAGSCLPGIHDEIYTDEFYLYEGRCYYTELYLRTGCALYGQWMKYEAKYEDEDWYFPSSTEFLSCQYDECIKGRYGPSCQDKCEVDCHGHGHCDDGLAGTGQCICDDGYDPPDCSEMTPIYPANCSQGVKFVVYHDEIGFTREYENKIVENVNYDNIGYTYNAIVVSGSIDPPARGQYQLRLQAKPYGQLVFDGQLHPSSLGPAGACSGFIKTEAETDYLFWNQGQTYPFSLKYRSGCGVIAKYLRLQWKNGPKYGGDVTHAPWEDIPTQYLFSCQSEECVPGRFGEDCTGVCPTCPDHSFCLDGKTGNGTCMCETGYFGDDCSSTCGSDADCGNGVCSGGSCHCNDGFHGLRCDKQCSREETCSGHGTCSDVGGCICDDGYYGPSCSQRSDTEHKDDCPPGAVYTRFSSESLFERPNDGPRIVPQVDINAGPTKYNGATIFGSVVVDTDGAYEFKIVAHPYAQFTFMGENYPENIGPSGSCESITTEATTPELELKAHMLYPYTILYRSGCDIYTQDVKLMWKPKGASEFIVIPSENLRACSDQKCAAGYLGEDCIRTCETGCGEHGECMLNEHNKTYCECDQGYYGKSCEIKCDAAMCNHAGACSVNGTCECFDGFAGENCTESVSRQTQGNTMSCPHSATIMWHANEHFGVAVKQHELFDIDMEIPSSTDHQSITIVGSISPVYTNYYRFRATGKPTSLLKIDGAVVHNDFPFDTARCLDNVTATSESEPVFMHKGRMYRFTLQYRSGCASTRKFLELEYQWSKDEFFDDAEWLQVDADILRSCPASECESGRFGADCRGLCPECGSHGRCSDGVHGSGKCVCEMWYFGGACLYDMLDVAVVGLGALFVVCLVFVCWPVKGEATSDDMGLSTEPLVSNYNSQTQSYDGRGL